MTGIQANALIICSPIRRFGVEWKIQEDYVKEEYADKGFNGRFGAGLPRINDGSLLFLQHMISKMKQPEKDKQGSRIAVVFNGSPLFTGDAIPPAEYEETDRRRLRKKDRNRTPIAPNLR